MMRLFIIFHDCGHGSFFKSQKANDILGNITGIINFTPYARWRHDHAVHHATAGDLDHRGKGDVYTMTVKEYLAAPWYKKLGYRIMRNPFALFLVGPLLVFVDRSTYHRTSRLAITYRVDAGRFDELERPLANLVVGRSARHGPSTRGPVCRQNERTARRPPDSLPTRPP